MIASKFLAKIYPCITVLRPDVFSPKRGMLNPSSLRHPFQILARTKLGRSAEREGTKMLGSIVEDHRTIDLDVKWHGEFDGATLKGRYSTGKKLRTKARDRANCDF